ncbi:glycoside hydrolase family 25 protein [Sandaracinomonas limnophila]|uniref:Glycoside hydrolase family 25 protein n=1 Tax=Sandaracinomonas limnophila TaxID=1862386 RepID=A0A437PWV0_9BACT|nr:glycoside hydrolase family 25 protein [Sandaracinomonas limnophila]
MNFKSNPIFKANKLVLLLLLALFNFSCRNKKSNNQFAYSESAKIDLPQNHQIHGIDLSHFNGKINFDKIKDIDLFDTTSIKFIYIKATEGKTLKDKYFEGNWKEAHEKGFKCGAYHFFIPNRDPEEQAELFCNIVKLSSGDLPPVCDFESPISISKEKLKAKIQIFLDKLQDNYGVKPIIYTNKKLYHKIFKEEFSDYNFWIAHYDTEDVDQTIENLVFWQHNKDGKLPGHAGKFDYNVFLGDEEDFNSLLIK